MSNIAKHIETLFAAAAELSGEPRQAFLDRESAGQDTLRRQLDGLLQAHDQMNHLLDQPLVGFPGTEETCQMDKQAAGTLIAGRYKLLEQIGDGGMGTVWMAEQKEPVKRLVAVKLIKAGMDSKAVLARFEAERQALALMDHPNIAKVHDAGTDDQGRPYFAMELVKGLPLTEYCDARKLSVNERLDLFIQICSAVQHAHQKAIIHRDLKPANVLVTEHDGKPVPKVIDFGLAKALNSSQMLTDRTLHTAYGTVVGTPLYMAPEQVGINALDVDTRSDVYALGVLLYELLTGTTPLEKARFKEAAWEEMKRLIREEEPPRPSTRLSADKTLASLAASRQVEAAKLPGLVRGELDWIVMKALEKDRSRRYDTANGLARDVQRYLKGDTVEACPPSVGYRLRKAYRRNKPAVWIATAFVGLITAAAIMGVTLAVRAEKARRGEVAERQKAEEREAEANEQRMLARKEQQRAEQEKQRAEEEKRASEAVRSFLQDDLLRQADMLKQADTLSRTGGDFDIKSNPTINELLDRAAVHLTPERIDVKFPNLPFVQAEVLHAVSNAYSGIGQGTKALALIDRAVPLYQTSRGPTDRATLASRASQALIHRVFGQAEEGARMLAAVAADCRREFGPRDRVGFDASIWHGRALIVDGYPAEAILHLHKLKAEGIDYFGADDNLTILAAGHLAMAYRLAGRIPEAIAEMEDLLAVARAAKFRPDHPMFDAGFGELAEAYKASGRSDKAIEVWRQFLAAWEERGEPYRESTWIARHEVAWVYAGTGATEEAARLFEENLQAAKEPENALKSLNGAQQMMTRLGRHDAALEFARKGLTTILAGQPPNFRSWYTGMARRYVGELLYKRKEYVEAEPLLLAAVSDLTDFYGDRPHWDQGNCLAGAHRALVSLYKSTNRPEEANRLVAERRELLDALAQKELAAGNFTSATLSQLRDTVLAEVNAERHDKALSLWREIEAKINPADRPTEDTWLNLSGAVLNVYEGKMQFDLMKPWAELRIPTLEHNLDALRKTDPLEVPLLRATNRLAFSYLYAARNDDVVRLGEETIARQKANGWRSDNDAVVSYGSMIKAITLAGRPDLAAEMSSAVLAEVQKSNPIPAVLANATFSLGFAGLNAGSHMEAEVHLREAVRLYEQVAEIDWTMAKYQTWLGFALLELKNYAEAESVLKRAYSVWELELATAPAWEKHHPLLIAGRLATLYEALNQPDEAATWKMLSEPK